MIYNCKKMGSYNLHTIKTNKFKLIHVEVIFRNNVVIKDLGKRNLLFDILSDVSNKYPTRRSLALKLEELYSANIYGVTSRIGNAVVSNFCLDFINPKLVDDKELTNEAFELLFEMIFNPLANNNEFDSSSFELCKQRLIDDINGIKENPKKLSIVNALKNLGENNISSYPSIGLKDDILNITPANLYDYYLDVLKHDLIDVYVIGDIDEDNIYKIVNKYADFNIIKNHDVNFYLKPPKFKLKEYSDNSNNAQTNLVCILSLNNLNSYEQKYVANLYNIILGGGSLETKLYRHLRGENSLCYNVNSMYQKYDGLILITTAVDINAKKKAISLIKQSIKEMQVNITDEEIDNAKKIVASSLNMAEDNIGRIVDNYFYRNASDLDELDVRKDKFSKITKEDLYKLAKKISVTLLYSLDGSLKAGDINENN